MTAETAIAPGRNTPAPQSDEDLAKRNWEAYVKARDLGHLKYIEDAKRFDGYYIGDGQWDEAAIAKLDAEGRPYLTINLVLSTVNAIIGQYVRTRQQVNFQPAGSGANESISHVLNQVLKHIDEQNQARHRERTMFDDALVLERGYLDIRMDYTKNVLGDVREIVLDPLSVIPDSYGSEYDPDTWSEVTVSRWYTIDDIEALHGKDKADKLFNMQSPGDEWGYDAIEWINNRYGDVVSGNEWDSTPEDARRMPRIRVIDRQYRVLKRRKYFVDMDTGDQVPVPDGWDDVRVGTHAAAFELDIIERVERRIRWTISALDCLLYDGWSPYEHFTVIPFFPYFRRGRPFGPIRNLVSPQDLLNKMTSQELHVINTSANSGWVIEGGSLLNMDVADLERDGSKTGLVIEFNKGAQPPEKIQPNTVPTGIDRMADKAGMFFPQISGVSHAMLGTERRAEVSGVAMDRRTEGGMLQLEVIFDNLQYTRWLRARHILDLIQKFYTEPRMFYISSQDDEGREMYEELMVNQPMGPTGTILNDLTVGRYNIRVDTVPDQKSMDDVAFQSLMSMREAGVMVPDWAIFETSNLPNKRELAEWSRRMTGALEPSPEEIEKQQQMEEMQMRMMVAEVELKMAQTRERLANAQLMVAKAEKEAGQHDHEMRQLAYQIRADLEQQMVELQQNREDLQLRLRVAQGKEQTELEKAKISSITGRINEAVKGKTMLGVAELSAQAKKASPASKPKGR
jgi:hypothetical protein